MDTSPLTVPIFDLVLCISQAVDLISPLIADHHKRTAHIAFALGVELGLPEAELRDVVIAAALHDVGGLSREDRIITLDFEFDDTLGHSVLGYLLLKSFPPFEKLAQMVRFHHNPWENGAGAVAGGVNVPRGSQILHLADRVAVLVDPAKEILEQSNGIMERIHAQSGDKFDPSMVKALDGLAGKEAFWLDTLYSTSLYDLDRQLNWPELQLSDDTFLGLVNLFRRIIDFRSSFTATHSAGVAACAEELARLEGFSKEDCRIMRVAGYLHDLGKLAVPREILEKPASLSREEFDVMRRHTYYTFHLLEPLKIMDTIRVWGSFHHEHIDGHGYPFHLGESGFTTGSRIVAVADVFTALTEDRPYRGGMDTRETMQVIQSMVQDKHLDAGLVETLSRHLPEMNAVRSSAQAAAVKEYFNFTRESKELQQI